MVTFRPATADDSPACFAVFQATLAELGQRTGGGADSTADEPDPWAVRRPVFEHLARTADAWWIAEDSGSGQTLGYARSILRDGVRELTEFFVLPDAQGAGVGRELLARAFPATGARHRAIIATVDPRAIARYLGTGLDARLPLAAFEGVPHEIDVPTDLQREPLQPDQAAWEATGAIDREILGFRRPEDHEWLMSQRPGWLYRRAGRPVAYGYHPTRPGWGGPLAALDPDDLPILLAEAESAAAGAGHATVAFDLPLVARPAIDHLLARRFRVDPFVMFLFTDGPVDRLAGYGLTGPPFFA